MLELHVLAFVKCYRSFKNIGLLLSGPVHLTLNGGLCFPPKPEIVSYKTW